jgi:subtilisin family serine protease
MVLHIALHIPAILVRLFLLIGWMTLLPTQRLSAQSIGQSQPNGPIGVPVPHRYLVAYRNGSTLADAAPRALAAGLRVVRSYSRFAVAVVNSSAGTDDETALAQLRAQPDVEFAVHDRILSAYQLALRPTPRTFGLGTVPIQSPASFHPYDAYYTSTPQGWAVRQAGGYGAGVPGGPVHGPWDTTMGAGIRIAILDSGVDAYHPDIAPNLAFNLSEIDQSPATGVPSACDDGTPQDQQGHGTWTASLAAGAIGPGTGLIVGVAPTATLLNIKVLERMTDPSSTASDLATQCSTGQASGLLSWVIQGIDDAVAQNASVISLSLGTLVDLETGEGAGLQALFNRATYAATQAGAVIVAAAGNDGFDLSNPRYVELPAQARDVLAIVASTNPACAEDLAPGASCAPGPVTLPYYSNYGARLNALAAPGGSYPDGTSDTGISGWIRGACSAGIPNTLIGPPTDSAHSFGCFNLGHDQYVEAIGTSASAALAAGAAALLRAANPTWTPAQVVAALRASAVTAPSLAIPQLTAQ